MRTPFLSISLFLFITVSILGMYEDKSIYTIGFYGKVVVIITTIFLTFFLKINRVVKLKIDKKIIPLIVFLLFIFIGAIHGILSKQVDGIEYILYTNYFILTIIYLYCLSLFNLNLKSLINIFHRTLIFNFIIGLILTFVLNIDIYDYADGGFGDGGLSLFLEKRTSFALICILGVFIEFYLYSQKKKLKYLSFFLFYLVLLFLSNNRTTILVLLIFFSIYTVYKIRDKFNRYIRYSLYMFLLLFILLSTAFLYQDIISFDYESVSSGRTMIWGLALYESTRDFSSILLGNGIFSLGHYIAEKYVHLSYHFQEVDILSMHSSYIEIFIAGGLLTLVSFFILIYKVLGRDRYIDAVVVSMLFIGLLEGVLIMPTIPTITFFWLLVIISLKDEFKMKKGSKYV